MHLEEAQKFLHSKGIQHPVLEVLEPTIDDYDVLLLQPKGDIEASKARVGHRDQSGATQQCLNLLEWAASQRSDLVVTPEYCVPWDALIGAVRADYLPGAGCL